MSFNPFITPMLSPSTIFAYPLPSPLQSPREDSAFNKDPSESTLLVKRVVFDCIEDDENELDLLQQCKDQGGCRKLQCELRENPAKWFNRVFSVVLSHLPDLMTNAFGNYLCQKIFEECDEQRLTAVVQRVCPYVKCIGTNLYGTRALQRLIEAVVRLPALEDLLRALQASAVALAKDVNGNHVIQQCLLSLEYPLTGFIYEAVCASVLCLGTSRHGCCILERCLDTAVGRVKFNVIKTVVENCIVLVQDPYGNYVMQYLLELGIAEVNEKLLRIFTQNILLLSKQKFSSNVIEKCLALSERHSREILVQAVKENATLMIFDPYANYGKRYIVVQRALLLADSARKAAILAELRPLASLLKSSEIGKKVYQKLLKKHPSLLKAN